MLFQLYHHIRARHIASILSEHIQDNSTLLDIGCGNMLISSNITKLRYIQVHGIDVELTHKTNLPFSLFDGKTLPFENKSFDTCMLIDVFHHIRHQRQLLSEALRVTRDQILVFEDIYMTKQSRAWLHTHHTLRRQLCMKQANDHIFRTHVQWSDFFRHTGLHITHSDIYYNPLLFTHYALFVLSPQKISR